jgi:outer membrane phospholipase A
VNPIRHLRWLWLLALLCAIGAVAATPEYLIASPDGKAAAGEDFEIIVVSAAGKELPDELALRMRDEVQERILPLRAAGPAEGAQRTYVATMPPGVVGTVSLDLSGRSSSVLGLTVAPRRDALEGLTGGGRAGAEYEPPLSENDPMYFVIGARDGYSARFQLSFKYRLFDIGSGFGRERPWLSGFYFGYTQNSLWDLSSSSKAFRDTNYRPSIFWKWEREDQKTFVDSVRLGLEHESNGRDGPRSRSINIAFVRPEWRLRFAGDHTLQLAPKVYKYLEREENPDIQQYRGHIDWQARYDAAGDWVATAVVRRGTIGKGSVLVDFSKRSRDLRFGPIGGYFHVQYFRGYGEDILDYDVRRKSQLRLGFAIVP